LISTDFDGTVANSAGDLHPEFIGWIAAWKRQTGGQWMINTGRWMDSLLDELGTQSLTVWPDWLGLGEREVWRRSGRKYVPVDEWNTACERAHAAMVAETAATLAEIARHMQRTGMAQVLHEQFACAGLFAYEESNAHVVAEYLDAMKSRHESFDYARNGAYFRFCHASYHKGACLAEVQRLTSVGPADTFAAGDHFNDLPMLRPQYAAHLACPSNAIPEVRAQVARHGGFLAGREHALGVLDALTGRAARAG
jgi:hypothetical protein